MSSAVEVRTCDTQRRSVEGLAVLGGTGSEGVKEVEVIL